MADSVQAWGLIVKVNDDYKVLKFDTVPVTLTRGASLSVTVGELKIAHWLGEQTPGLEPVWDALKGAPRPPRFATQAEADAWLDSYPHVP